MNEKKHIAQDAFLRPALDTLEIDTEDEALFRKFVVDKAGKIDELWADFLQHESMDRLMARTPTMRTMIRHTPLSNRIKNVMKYDACLETVGELMQYSPDELRKFRGLGEKSVNEIVEYLKSTGLFVLPNQQ